MNRWLLIYFSKSANLTDMQARQTGTGLFSPATQMFIYIIKCLSKQLLNILCLYKRWSNCWEHYFLYIKSLLLLAQFYNIYILDTNFIKSLYHEEYHLEPETLSIVSNMWMCVCVCLSVYDFNVWIQSCIVVYKITFMRC